MNSNELKFTHDKMHLFLKLLFLDNFRLLKKFSKQYRKFSYILNSVSHNIKNLYNRSTIHTTKKLTLVRCCRLNRRLHLDSYQFFCCCPSLLQDPASRSVVMSALSPLIWDSAPSFPRFMLLRLLKSTAQLFCRTSFNLG